MSGGIRSIETDILVVGGGSAGLSAARAAAEAGARVDLVDAGAAPGGQYWMQDPVGPPATRQQREGAAATAAALKAGVAIHHGAEVWAAFPGDVVHAHAADGDIAFRYRAIIIATGAHDRVYPFPGWTLPGVMTAGAGQRLAKLGKTAPGRRIALAGNGAFLHAVAATLADLGARPDWLIEANAAEHAVRRLVAAHPTRWREALALAHASRKTANRRRGWIVTEALGAERLEAIRIAPLSAEGEVQHARAETVEGIDALLVGWGFRPMIELTALLRCRHIFDRDLGGWQCAVSRETGRTSVPHVYAAGEVTGIAGARPARLSGQLAGYSAAAELGHVDADLAARRLALLPKLAAARAFGETLMRLYPVPAGITALARADTVLCRCEGVTRGEISAALASGTRTVTGAKFWTRVGMGRCQGRICGAATAEIVAAETGMPIEQAGFNTPRIPLRPVPLTSVLAATTDIATAPPTS